MKASVDHVVSMSGGKDSVASSLHLSERGIEHQRIFCDTGWEHLDTYRYLDDVLEPHLGKIERLQVDVPIAEGAEADVAEIEDMLGISPSAMARLCIWKACFPAQSMRWCTQTLKTVPAARWLDQQDGDVVNVVGIRAAESRARAAMPEREPMPRVEVPPVVRLPGEGVWIDLSHVEQWRPIIAWSVKDVVAIHARHNLPMNPLYRAGSTRVGCWPCIFANKQGLAQFAAHDPGRVAVIRRLEAIVARRAADRRDVLRKPGTPPPTWFQARDPAAENGSKRHGSKRHLCIPIDRAIQWANTKRGGRQCELFAPPSEDWACSRWGYCEVDEVAK